MELKHERRHHPRMLCAELVEVSWFSVFGRESRRVANLEDISTGGLCLQVETPIPIGSPVWVRHRSTLVRGTVAHSFFRDQATFLGVLIDERFWPAMRELRPAHLLDPRELLLRVVVRDEKRDTSPFPS